MKNRLFVRRAVQWLAADGGIQPFLDIGSGLPTASNTHDVDELADRLAGPPDNGQIVAYCRGACCVLAHDAIRLLRAHGRDAARLQDGMLE